MSTTEIISFISGVPDVVWSGLLASLLTLGGVLLSNSSNTKRLKIQLKHDASEKAKERTGKLRQDVYLKAAEELMRANNFLGSLPTLDFSKKISFEDMQGLNSVVAKLQLVAEPTTALIVNDLGARYGAATMRLLSASTPLRDNQMKIDIATKFYAESSEKCQGCVAKLMDMTDSVNIDQEAFKQVQNRYEHYSAQADKYSSERENLYSKSPGLHLEFIKSLMTEMHPLNKLFVKALVAIREDLGLSAEAEKFEEQMNRQSLAMEKEVKNLIEEISAETDEKS